MYHYYDWNTPNKNMNEEQKTKKKGPDAERKRICRANMSADERKKERGKDREREGKLCPARSKEEAEKERKRHAMQEK